MTGVITLFGESDLQPSLKKHFLQNELLFVCKNAETSVQLIGFVEEHLKKTDAVVISSSAVLLESLFDFGVLTKYITDTEVEEININSWNCIEVIYPDKSSK